MMWSHRRRLSRLPLAVNLLLFAGCASASRPSPGAPLDESELAGPFAELAPSAVRLPSHPGYADPRLGGRLGALLGKGMIPAPAPDTLYVLDRLTSAVVDARFDDTLGDRLQDVLDAAEDEGRPVEAYGTGALDIYELLGDDIHAGACEIPRVTSTVEHDGASWEITLGLAMMENFVGELTQAMGEVPAACAEGLLEAAGDLDATRGCATVDEAMFFPEGSDCRACLEESVGDIAVCQDVGRCAEEAPVLEALGGELWNRFEGTLLTCAPDWTVPAYVLAHPDDTGALPDPFDYGGDWGYVCAPFWDAYVGDVSFTCHGGLGDTLRVGVEGLVEGMRQDGGDTPWYRHRGYYTPRISLADGVDIRYAWEAYTSLGVVAYPAEPDDSNGDGVVDAGDDYYGYQYGSWGLNPMLTRPDGTDPAVLDDTFARDWFGAIALKTATTRNGVSILMANHTRCADDAWEDRDGDGSFRCTRTEDPAGGWLGDLPHFRWDPEAGYSYPMPVVTLGSTGLPDPEIPGNIVPWVASTPTLGDPEWDGCTWNDTFVPDRAPLPDTPLDYTGAGSIDGDTWRFGGHPETDLRVLLYTNLTRDYCPDGVTP